MVSKTRKNDFTNGFTLIEILVSVVVFALLVLAVLQINPIEAQRRARDNKRLSDITTLERAILEYKIDNGELPGTQDVTWTSNNLPDGFSGPFEDAESGWIDGDLSVYLSKLPADPVNDNEFRYYYRHNGFSYELNANLEFQTDLEGSDGGNDPFLYELGDDLTVL